MSSDNFADSVLEARRSVTLAGWRKAKHELERRRGVMIERAPLQPDTWALKENILQCAALEFAICAYGQHASTEHERRKMGFLADGMAS